MTQQTDHPPLKCQRLRRDLTHGIKCPCNGVAKAPVTPEPSKRYFRKRAHFDISGCFPRFRNKRRLIGSRQNVTDFPLFMSSWSEGVVIEREKIIRSNRSQVGSSTNVRNSQAIGVVIDSLKKKKNKLVHFGLEESAKFPLRRYLWNSGTLWRSVVRWLSSAYNFQIVQQATTIHGEEIHPTFLMNWCKSWPFFQKIPQNPAFGETSAPKKLFPFARRSSQIGCWDLCNCAVSKIPHNPQLHPATGPTASDCVLRGPQDAFPEFQNLENDGAADHRERFILNNSKRQFTEKMAPKSNEKCT